MKLTEKLRCNFFFLSGFSFSEADDSENSRERERTIFIPLYHFQPLTNIQRFTYSFCISDDNLSFSITARVVTTLLLDEMYLPLEIKI